MASKNKNSVYSANQAAKALGVVNQTVINWIKDGHLKAFRTPGNQYRIYEDDLIDFLKERNMRLPDFLADKEDSADSSYRLLIVDDDKDVNTLIYRYIRKKFPEFEVSQAYNGFEAGKLLTSLKPDIVLLDIDLPGINGHELCKQIKNDSEFGSPIVFVISGLDSNEDKTKILDEGADDFFSKPVDFDRLESRIRQVMRI